MNKAVNKTPPITSAVHANSLALRANQLRHPLFQPLTVNCIAVPVLSYLVLHLCARGRRFMTSGLGERGIRHRVEVDPDCGVPPVDPMAYMPLTDLVTCPKCG